MKKLFIILVLANLLADFGSYFLLPANVATHFNGDNNPNGWFSAVDSLVFNLGLHGLFFFMVYMSSNALLKMPKEAISLPNKDYWLSDKNLPAFKIKWDRVIFQFGSALMLLFLVMSILIIEANFSNPVKLNATAFVGTMFGFLIFMLYWIISVYKTFRIPE